MKRLLVAVLVLAGCASRAPEERPLPPGMVAVATFTADADPVAGTFTIRSQPTAAGRARGMTGLLSTEVLVENDADAPESPSPWFLETADRGCGEGTATWGAYVRVTSLLGDSTWLGGVYAEITDFEGDAGGEGCNSAVAPEGLNSDFGLWSYPTIGPGTDGSQSVAWTFGRVSATAVRFSGRIVAAKMTTTTVSDSAVYPGDQTLASNGTNMVYASGQYERLQFVAFDGTDAGVSAPLPGFATAISPDVEEGHVWYTTEAGEVGFVLNAGRATGYSVDGNNDLGGLVTDPTVPGRAWYRANEEGYIRSVDFGYPPSLGEPVSTMGFSPWGMAFGQDGKLYVTAPNDNAVLVFSTDALGAVFEGFFVVPEGTDCLGPTSIILGPDGNLWFGAIESNAVCTMTTTGDFTRVNDAEGPAQLAIGPDDKVWVAAIETAQVARMDATGPGYRITLLNEYDAFGVATGDGHLWASDSFGVYPILLDSDPPPQ